MSNEQKTKKEQPKPAVLGPGAILKAAREKNGLTVADIATKLHLKLVNIESIEADDFDPSVALTFTKGYLKLYARQVNVPESDVLEAFASLNVEEKEPAKLQSFSKRVAKQANDDRLMMITYFIIAAVAALVVIWWFQRDSAEVAQIPVQQPEVAQAAVIQTPVVQAPVEVENDSNESEATPDDLIVSAQFDVETEVETEEPFSDTTTGTTSETNQLEEIVQDQVDLNAPQTAQAQSIELVFEFADNCWMNLVDSTGEAIAYGVKKSGRVMTVSGVSPFEVTLGAPQVVSISYDGVPVDMSRFSPGVTAKFLLPFSD